MSWAAHEFENYFIQKHTGMKVSFLAIVLGTLSPDLFTKSFVYGNIDPAAYHRGWPGVGFTHSLSYGLLLGLLVLGLTRSRSWALGILIGQWAHVLTDVADTAGVMVFFPFSTEPVTISMWRHAAAEGRYGDAAAYYSSLGGVWDLFWFVMVVLFARRALSKEYFRTTVIPADPRVWGWMNRRLKLTEAGLLTIYRGFMFYGLGRMIAWFLYARFAVDSPWSARWNGPRYLPGNDISDAGWVEVLWRTALGGVLFALALFVIWKLIGRRLWDRGIDPPSVRRGRGLRAVFGE